MRFSTFRKLTDNRPKTYSGWKTFIEKLDPPLVIERKDLAPLYCPAVFLEGGTRTDRQVLYISFGVMDIDQATPDQVAKILDDLIEMNLGFVYHTSYRYAQYLKEEGLNKCRILLPFSRPVDPDEWDRVWYMLNEMCDGLGDPACKHPNAIYFFPSHPPSGHGEVLINEGDPVDVDWLIDNCPDISTTMESAFRGPSEEFLARVDIHTRYTLAQKLLEAFPKAVVGEGGDRQTLKAAYVGHDFGLSQEDFWPLLLWYNQTKCFRDGKAGSWEEKKLRKKLENAYKYPKMPFGWRLVGQEEYDEVTAKDLMDLAKTFSKKKAAKDKAKGRALRSMLEGAAVKGEDPVPVVVNMAKFVASHFPYGNPHQVSMFFEECFDKTAHRDITTDMMADHIQEELEQIQASKAEAARLRHEEEKSTIKLMFQRLGIDRDSEYTDDEVIAFADPFGDLLTFNKNGWIIRKGKSFYFWVLDQYVGPFLSDEALNAAHFFLSPAHFALFEMGPQGPQPKGLQQLVNDHGSVAKEIVADMSIQKSYFEPQTGTLYEATCPKRDITPKYHEDVETWLFYLCSEDERVFNKLLDWLASLPDTAFPTAALFIYGERATGKSLLGHGCSRLWTTHGPTEIEDVAGAFNSKLAECPLVLGDEGPPKDNRGDPQTTLLRKIIQEHSRTYRRKHLPDATLKGAMRVILTANNIDVLVPKLLELDNHDIQAINERFLLIEVDSAKARSFLNSLDEEDRWQITHGDAIAEFAMWLHENRNYKKGARLLVEGFPGSELETRMTTGTGIRADVCNWIGAYLLSPERLVTQGKKPVVAKDQDSNRNRLLISADMLERQWNTYLTSQQKPSKQALSRAITALSIGNRVKHKKSWYYRMNLDHVRTWCCRIGICDEDAFDEALAKHHLTHIRVVDEG